MRGRLAGKIALVIGAGAVGSGWRNGRALAARFIKEGATVVGTDLDGDALAETKAMIEARAGDGAVFYGLVADAKDDDDLDRAIEACIDPFGRIDVAVNNVGGSAPGDAVSTTKGGQFPIAGDTGPVFPNIGLRLSGGTTSKT